MKARFSLGLIPMGSDPQAAGGVASFAAALGAALGVPIDLHRAADYRAVVAGMEQGLVDFAWLPPLSAARVVKSGAGVPAAVTVRHGTTSYMTGLVAMKTSRVATLADVKDVRAAWVDRESASGYVVIRAALRKAGLSLVDAFREEIFVRSHEEVARALLDGRADVGATAFNASGGAVEIARLAPGKGLALADVRILAQAGPIPADMFAVRSTIAPSALTTVQNALVDARPGEVHRQAKLLMLADGFERPLAAHAEMIERLFDLTESPMSRR